MFEQVFGIHHSTLYRKVKTTMMLILVSVLILLVAVVAIIGFSYQLGMNSGVSLMSRKVEVHLKEVEDCLGGDEKCAALVYYLRSKFNIRAPKSPPRP